MRARITRRTAIVTTIALLAMAVPAAAAVLGLPLNGSQVNNDPAAGIDPAQSAGLSDIQGGSLTAGGARVPWGTFEQKAGSAQHIFVRAFKNGQWVTQGQSLNISPNVEAEAPSIDFAGTGRTVPWDAWYEPNAHLGSETNIFASRFIAAQNRWQPEGQDRAPNFKVPSLNIHTNREAENPSVAGGATVAGNDPVPWVTWQEQDGNVNNQGTRDQIFVSKGVKQSTCAGFKPSQNNSVSAFCWQQVGLDRLAYNGGSSAAGDPTLNIDPSRNGIEPDIAFTGPNDTVPWVVWYEKDNSGLGLRNNEQVFAAKAVKDAGADGGFHWQAVGNDTATQTNVLDTSGPVHHFGNCAESTAREDDCTLNKVPTRDGEDPRVAAGTLTPGGTTVPWVVWAEDKGTGNKGVFVSRLVGGNHFELFNGGKPVSTPGRDAASPDITFLGNIPYISWIETRGGLKRGFVGHFEGNLFVTDTPGGIRLVGPPHTRASLIDFRVPISSSCTADPFTKDGSACPVSPFNLAFFLFTTAGSPQKLFGQVVIGGLNCVIFPGCRITIRPSGSGVVIRSRLGQRNRVGILVQRVVRTRRVHGRRVLVLRRVGRVPLGTHRKGRVRLHWSLRVNGHRLRPGRYVITLRALDKRKHVLGKTKPVVFRVRR